MMFMKVVCNSTYDDENGGWIWYVDLDNKELWAQKPGREINFKAGNKRKFDKVPEAVLGAKYLVPSEMKNAGIVKASGIVTEISLFNHTEVGSDVFIRRVVRAAKAGGRDLSEDEVKSFIEDKKVTKKLWLDTPNKNVWLNLGPIVKDEI